MGEPVVFQRDKSVTIPTVVYAVAGVLAINGVAHLVDRQWLWAAVDLMAVALALLNLEWSRRTPIVWVDGGELVIHRHLLSRPRRLRLDAIAAVDETRPSGARLVLHSGQAVSVPLHCLAWGDRAPFLAYLRSVVERGVR